MTRRFLSAALALLLAGCAATPPKIAAPAPARPPVVLSPPQPAASDWRDQSESPGAWSYRRDAAGSTARFGKAGAPPDFELRCDTAARTIALSRAGSAPGAIAITTTYGPRVWPAPVVAGGRTTVTVPAGDPFLNQLAFSRGRWEVTGPALAPLILPAWAEPARVIEDCRA